MDAQTTTQIKLVIKATLNGTGPMYKPVINIDFADAINKIEKLKAQRPEGDGNEILVEVSLPKGCRLYGHPVIFKTEE